MANDVKKITVILPNIENLKTATAVKEELDKNGEVTDRRVITKVTFEAEIMPEAFADIQRLLFAGCPVHVVVASPQAMMGLDVDTGEIREPVPVAL